jgi:hypothetical protein
MQAWADFIDPIIVPDVMDGVDNVVPLKFASSA